ncbi:putative Ig domain-containing protein [Burkholderia pyrrocinia]|uniref:putative Ig domain-containing protein n=1 Tax=Burkholderia pyrrocinia TaxID=60550 RepID=UPI003D766A3B
MVGGEVRQCAVSPGLPAGLTLGPETGTISGTPSIVSSRCPTRSPATTVQIVQPPSTL